MDSSGKNKTESTSEIFNQSCCYESPDIYFDNAIESMVQSCVTLCDQRRKKNDINAKIADALNNCYDYEQNEQKTQNFMDFNESFNNTFYSDRCKLEEFSPKKKSVQPEFSEVSNPFYKTLSDQNESKNTVNSLKTNFTRTPSTENFFELNVPDSDAIKDPAFLKIENEETCQSSDHQDCSSSVERQSNAEAMAVYATTFAQFEEPFEDPLLLAKKITSDNENLSPDSPHVDQYFASPSSMKELNSSLGQNKVSKLAKIRAIYDHLEKTKNLIEATDTSRLIPRSIYCKKKLSSVNSAVFPRNSQDQNSKGKIRKETQIEKKSNAEKDCPHPKINKKQKKINKKGKKNNKKCGFEKRFMCFICELRFGNSSQLERHKITHRSLENENHQPYASSSLMKVKCYLCNNSKNYKTYALLKSHIKKEHGFQNFTCNECSLVFKKFTDLEKHALSDHFSKCPKCEKVFMDRSSLEHHISNRCRFESFTCHDCADETKFESKFELEAHIKTRHQLSQPFFCEICKTQLRSEFGLVQHKLKQHFIGPFECSECAAFYSDKRSLELHSATHHQNSRRVDSSGSESSYQEDEDEINVVNGTSCQRNRVSLSPNPCEPKLFHPNPDFIPPVNENEPNCCKNLPITVPKTVKRKLTERKKITLSLKDLVQSNIMENDILEVYDLKKVEDTGDFTFLRKKDFSGYNFQEAENATSDEESFGDESNAEKSDTETPRKKMKPSESNPCRDSQGWKGKKKRDTRLLSCLDAKYGRGKSQLPEALNKFLQSLKCSKISVGRASRAGYRRTFCNDTKKSTNNVNREKINEVVEYCCLICKTEKFKSSELLRRHMSREHLPFA